MNKKVALIYDRVNTPYGGAENVLISLKEIFPDAPIFTSVYNPQNAKWAKNFKIVTSFIQKIPKAKSHHRLFTPLMPSAFESFDLSDFEMIISVSSAEAKGIITRPDQLHISYLLTPPRYLHSHSEETLKSRKILLLPGIKQLVKLIMQYLKWWDEASILRPNYIVPISHLVKKRVKKYYGLDTEDVLYPPVKIKPNFYNKSESTSKSNILSTIPKKYYLVVSRLVYYKKIDLAISACQHLSRNLVIVGEGPHQKKLKSMLENKSKTNSSSNIFFLGSQSNNVVSKLFKNCEGVLTPGKEDFGITSIEANSFGKPVILFHKSGAAELIKDKVHGIHLKQHTTKSMIKAIKELEKTSFSKKELLQNVEKYGTNRFIEKFQSTVIKLWNKYQKELNYEK